MTLDRPRPVWDFSWFASGVPSKGWIHDYVRYAIQCTDAPPLYHILAATTAVASAISHFTDLTHFNRKHPLHMFALLLGPSGESRKSTSLAYIEDVTGPAFRKVSARGARLWRLEASSPEGILVELAAEQTRYILISEWTHFNGLGQSGYWKHAPEFWNQRYDATPIDRVNAKGAAGRVKIERPRVTLLAASTPSLVQTATGLIDWTSGKLARYLIGHAVRDADLEMDTEIDNPMESARLANDFNRLVAPTSAGPITLPAEAWAAVQAWRHGDEWKRLKREAPEHLRPSFSRAQEHLLRVAAAYQASIDYPGRVAITPECVAAAAVLINTCHRELINVLGTTGKEDNGPVAKVERLIRSAGADGIGKRELLRQTRIKARELNEVIATLEERQDIHQQVERPAPHQPGRPEIRYRWRG